MTEPIPLSEPIKREDGKDVTSVSLRIPKSGEMRGLKLNNILQMDVSAMITLLPRISTPALTETEASDLPPPDIIKLSTAVVSFFMTPSEMAALTK